MVSTLTIRPFTNSNEIAGAGAETVDIAGLPTIATIAPAVKPVCRRERCNDPACRLDHLIGVCLICDHNVYESEEEPVRGGVAHRRCAELRYGRPLCDDCNKLESECICGNCVLCGAEEAQVRDEDNEPLCEDCWYKVRNRDKEAYVAQQFAFYNREEQ